MPKVRNVSDDERVFRDGRRVPPDGVVEVSEEEAAGFEGQERIWRIEGPRKAPAKSEEQG